MGVAIDEEANADCNGSASSTSGTGSSPFNRKNPSQSSTMMAKWWAETASIKRKKQTKQSALVKV